ncbi:MAG: hypothetical protein IKV85_01060, partial [Ruminococcus sp.]|nr:hypothetical protein [Ruminococcus sp.]
MKKLLSAVTSVLMASSFVTSAFASSFNVSAAGGVSAVQPNVSMEEVLDGAANKHAVQSDFVVKGTELKYVDGGDNYMDFYVESNGHKGAMLAFELASLPSGITVTVDKTSCLAFDHEPTWSLLNKTWGCDTMDPTTKDPLAFNDDEYVVSLIFDVDDSVADGTYEIGFDRFHVVEQPHQNFGPIVEFDATVVPGKLIIGEGGAVVTQPTSGNGDNQDDFIVKGSSITYDATKDNYMDFYVESNGHKGAMLAFEIANLPSGITAKVDEASCLAFDHEPLWSLMNKTWSCQTMDPTTKDPLAFNDDNYVVSLILTVDDSVAEGEYDITFSRFHVVEQPHENFGPIVEFDATVIPGKLIVEGKGDTPSDTTTPDDFVIKGSTLTLSKGSDYSNAYIDFIVEPGNHKAATLACEIAALPAGIKGSVTEPVCFAIPGEPAWTEVGSTYQCYCADATTHDPQSFIDGAVVVSVALSIPADIAAGEYEIDLKNFHVVEQGSEAGGTIVEFDSKVVPGKLIITDTPVAEGDATWVIDTVTAQAGTTVEVPVYVNGASTLEVAGATFEIAANGASFNKVNGNSAAYGNAPITNNAETNEFAFAQADGKGSAAADKAVIMVLTYDVPAGATGTIPVEWANVTVSDTNGNLITSKVKVENGAIIIDEPIDGEVTWVIDTVEGTPGATVEVPVYVNGENTVEVAGATFEINSEAGFNKVNSNSAAYGNAPITNNAETNEFAFAQADGKGSAAADKAVIMVLTYDVPADATGTIPVEWANVTVSDTNGNLITDKVKVVNGAIVIKPADEETVEWVIDTVKGTPGEPVEVPVYVNGANTVEVAGATFQINSEAEFSKVNGNSAAYGNAPITNNAETSEFAFAQADGKGSAAADKAVIMVLTYNVPADATGEIPVTWANVTVSDTNGNLITEQIIPIDGKIIIEEPVSSEDTTTTTTSGTTTTTTTSGTTTTTTSGTTTTTTVTPGSSDTTTTTTVTPGSSDTTTTTTVTPGSSDTTTTTTTKPGTTTTTTTEPGTTTTTTTTKPGTTTTTTTKPGTTTTTTVTTVSSEPTPGSTTAT